MSLLDARKDFEATVLQLKFEQESTLFWIEGDYCVH